MDYIKNEETMMLNVPCLELYHDNEEEAKQSPKCKIELVNERGYITNRLHEDILFEDINQNTQYYIPYQDSSPTYLMHLQKVISYLTKGYEKHSGSSFKECNIVELGCGNGQFIETLAEYGCKNLLGFDPAYNGNNGLIKKGYFDKSKVPFTTDLIVLRHVLEHISDPYDFMINLEKQLDEDCLVYIEVPNFDYIISNRAFYEITNMHCNYFTVSGLSKVAENVKHRLFFGDQYQGVLFSLKNMNSLSNLPYETVAFQGLISHIVYVRKWLISTGNIAVWGGGSKGIDTCEE